MNTSEEHLLQSLSADRFAAANGIEIVEVRSGFARGRMAVQPRHLDSRGLVHQGAVFTLAATTFFAACSASGRLALGIQMSIAYSAAARVGLLWAEARAEAGNGHSAAAVVRVCDEQGSPIAVFQGTAYRTQSLFPPPAHDVPR